MFYHELKVRQRPQDPQLGRVQYRGRPCLVVHIGSFQVERMRMILIGLFCKAGCQSLMAAVRDSQEPSLSPVSVQAVNQQPEDPN